MPFWISPRMVETCVVASLAWSASVLISSATTAEGAAVLAGGCRLDRGVERQQLRALGDVVHRGDDLADRLRLFAQRHDMLGDRFGLLLDGVHDLRHVVHRSAGRRGCDSDAFSAWRGDLLGAARHLLARLVDLVERGGGLLDGGELLLHARRLLLGGGQRFGGRGVEVVHRLAGLDGDLLQVGDHLVQMRAERADLVARQIADLSGQVAGTDAVDIFHQPVDRPDQPALGEPQKYPDERTG